MQGKIADFSIPEIFQLVASQNKSGSLAIRGEGRETVFLFSEGRIVDVQPDRRDPAALLGTMLVDAGFLTPQELRRFLTAQGGGNKKLGEVLTEKGKISSERLARYLYLQVKESVFDVLTLSDGEYHFEAFAVRPPSWMGDLIRPDVLLMEGMQYLDEYPMIREKFPPGEFRVTKKRGEKIDPEALSDQEKGIWKALDFSNDPRRVFRKACISWFEGIKGLFALQDRGLVEIGVPARESAQPGREIADELARRRLVAWERAVLWGIAAAIAATWIYTVLLSPMATRVFAAWETFF